jgi:hypothetical protein
VNTNMCASRGIISLSTLATFEKTLLKELGGGGGKLSCVVVFSGTKCINKHLDQIYSGHAEEKIQSLECSFVTC